MDSPRRYWSNCLQGSLDILHSWRFPIRPEWIGGFVDLGTDSRMRSNEARCMQTGILTAADRHYSTLHVIEAAGQMDLAGRARKESRRDGVAIHVRKRDEWNDVKSSGIL